MLCKNFVKIFTVKNSAKFLDRIIIFGLILLKCLHWGNLYDTIKTEGNYEQSISQRKLVSF